VDTHLASTIDFMNAHGVTHFDTHFENIVTDGRRFCVGDFGLGPSSDFELREDEVAFGTDTAGTNHGRAASLMPTVSARRASARIGGKRISAPS